MTNVVHRDFTERKPLPAPNSDFYEVYETLSAEELAVVKRVRAFMEAKVAPVITKYWVDDAFPFELLPAAKELQHAQTGQRPGRTSRKNKRRDFRQASQNAEAQTKQEQTPGWAGSPTDERNQISQSKKRGGVLDHRGAAPKNIIRRKKENRRRE